MKTITIELPDGLAVPGASSDEELAREIRLAAAIHWYSQRRISQARASELAGVTRQAFLEALHQAEVPASHATAGELAEELGLGPPTDR
jgi:predicted HTH domain antitoxin